MTRESIAVMDIRSGHDTWDFDPTNEDSVKKMVRQISEKLKNGFYLYGMKKDGTYTTIQKPEDITNSKIEEFLLTKEMKKRMISLPETSG